MPMLETLRAICYRPLPVHIVSNFNDNQAVIINDKKYFYLTDASLAYFTPLIKTSPAQYINNIYLHSTSTECMTILNYILTNHVVCNLMIGDITESQAQTLSQAIGQNKSLINLQILHLTSPLNITFSDHAIDFIDPHTIFNASYKIPYNNLQQANNRNTKLYQECLSKLDTITNWTIPLISYFIILTKIPQHKLTQSEYDKIYDTKQQLIQCNIISEGQDTYNIHYLLYGTGLTKSIQTIIAGYIPQEYTYDEIESDLIGV